jgi:hypothetical protein
MRAQGFPVVSASLPGVNCGKGEEFTVVTVTKPGACEGFDRPTGSAGDGKGLDAQLGDRVLRFGSLGLVVKDVEKPGSEPHEVYVPDDGLNPKRGGRSGATLSCGRVPPRKD